MFPIIKHFVKEFYNPEKDRTQSVIALAFCGTLFILQRASLLRWTKLLVLYYLKKMNSQLMNHLTIFPMLLCFFFLFAIQSIIRELKDLPAYRVRLIKANN